MRIFISFLLITLNTVLTADGIKIPLCCPSGEILSEVGCTKSQANLPTFTAQWTSGEETAVEFKLGPKFKCNKQTEVEVIIEDLFGPIEARINDTTGSLQVGNETEEIASYSNGEFCALYSNLYSEEIYTSYLVCYDAETPVESYQRRLTGKLYPTCLLISAILILITIICYLTVGTMRKTLFAKITLGFLINVFICYTLLAIEYNHLLGDDYRDFLYTKVCKVLGYIIHHTFIALFFWMSAMAFNIAKSLSTMKIVRNSKSSFKSFSMYFLFAQGIPLLFTIFIVLMDIFKPNVPLPNVGEYSCFIGSEYVEGKSFFTTSVFFYYYLIVLVIITFNIICFLVTAFNLSRHWQAMKDIKTTSGSDGRVEHFTIIIKLSVIMGVPWILDVISAGLQYSSDSPRTYPVRVALDILNLLTGVLIFLSLICKPSVWSQIKASYSGTEEDRRNLQLSNGSTTTTSFKKHSKGQLNNV